MWWVYMLECADRSLYTGITNDLDKRLAVHTAGKGAKYTRPRRPVILRYREQVASKGMALRREAEIKRLSKMNKLALAATQSIRRRARHYQTGAPEE